MTTIQRELLTALEQHPGAYLSCSRFTKAIRFSEPTLNRAWGRTHGKLPAWVTVKALVQAGRLAPARLDGNRVAFRLVEGAKHG